MHRKRPRRRRSRWRKLRRLQKSKREYGISWMVHQAFRAAALAQGAINHKMNRTFGFLDLMPRTDFVGFCFFALYQK